MHPRPRSLLNLSIGFVIVASMAAGCATSPSSPSAFPTGLAAQGIVPSGGSRTPSPVTGTKHQTKTTQKKTIRKTVEPPAGVPAVDMPNPSLTPGAAFNVTVSQICVPGYATSARNVSDAFKAEVYARYGIAWVPYQHEVDHLISLEVGGSNSITNLWPEPYAGVWGARTKDVLENRLHDLVCAHQLSLASAQHQEATDWVAAYLKYVGAPPAGTIAGSGSGSGSGSGGYSSGGYYASSYYTAHTIYCADDPEWKNLSPHYLVHFATWAQAIARFPTYHLHQPC